MLLSMCAMQFRRARFLSSDGRCTRATLLYPWLLAWHHGRVSSRTNGGDGLMPKWNGQSSEKPGQLVPITGNLPESKDSG
jgi:hypothetical protein